MPVLIPAPQPRSISPSCRDLLSLHSILNPDGNIGEQKPDQKRNVSQQEFTSPIESQGLYVTGQNNVHQGPPNPPIAMETARSSGQSSIQIMTIKSQQGHHIQIPVDVQAASKVADEKRKRNAGASARFRARRKEKEREASQSLSRLEKKIREAAEDVEHYRTEMDYFVTVVFQQPGAERHYARPTSPRLWRTSMPPSIAPSTAEAQSSLYSRSHEMLTPETSSPKGAKRTAPIVYDETSRKKANGWIEEKDHGIKAWNVEKDDEVIKFRNSGMGWDHISKQLRGRTEKECCFRYHNYLRKRTVWDSEKTEKLMTAFDQVGEEFFVKIVRNMDSEIVSWEDAQRRVFKIIAEEGYASGDPDGEPETEATQHHPQIAQSI